MPCQQLINYLHGELSTHTEATSLLPVSILQDFLLQNYNPPGLFFISLIVLIPFLGCKESSMGKQGQYWKARIQNRGKVLGKAGLFTLIV